MLATSAGILAPARRSSNAINLKSQVSLETHQAACHFSKQYSRSVCTPPLTFPVPAQPCSSPQRTWSTAVVVHCWRAPLHTPQDPCAPPQAQPGDACTARSTDMRSPRAAQRTRSPYRNTQGRPHSDSNRSDSRPRKEHASLSLQRKPAQQGTGHMQDSQACYPATCSAGWHAEVRAAADQATCLSNSAATAHWAFPDASSGAGNKFDSNTGVWRIKTTPQNVRCSNHGMRPAWAVNLLPDPRATVHARRDRSGAHSIHCTSRRWVSLASLGTFARAPTQCQEGCCCPRMCCLYA